MPAAATLLKTVAKEAASCTLCPLYRNATQTVFGEGAARAQIMLVGEQPGDQEDLAGHPFVGPAGKVLDRAMAEAGLDRKKVYLTNAVKHFKNEPRGKKRLHKRPNRYEVEVCRVWLRQEISLVKPQLILALGVTAAVALAGRPVVLSHGDHPSLVDPAHARPEGPPRRFCGPGEGPESGRQTDGGLTDPVAMHSRSAKSRGGERNPGDGR